MSVRALMGTALLAACTLAAAAPALPDVTPVLLNTGGPHAQLIYVYGREKNAREEPVAIFAPSVAADADSLRHLGCRVNNTDTPVTILHGSHRKAVLDDPLRFLSGLETDLWIVAQCGDKPWPNSANIDWIWGKEIAANGVISASDMPFRMTVRPTLEVAVACRHRPGVAACEPLGGLTFDFNEAVPASATKAIVVSGSSGASYAASPCGYGTESCRQIVVPGPFQEGETLTVSFAEALRDNDDRPLIAAPRTIEVARLPAHVSILHRSATLPWTPAIKVLWPIAMRNTEPAITVRSRRLAQRPADMPALLALHQMVEMGLDRIADPALNDQTFGLSQALLALARAGEPPITDQTITPSGPATEFVGLPLAGYGNWLIEADSPLHRAALHQRQVWSTEGPRPAAPELDWARLSLVQLTNLRMQSSMSKTFPSLIWVTSIDTGKPAGAVEVSLWSCDGTRLLQTVTDSDGRALFAHLPDAPRCSWSRERTDNDLWIVLRKADDVCIVRSGSLYPKDDQPTVVGQTVLNSVVFRAGETVLAHTVLRDQVASGFTIPHGFRGTLQIHSSSGALLHEEAVVANRTGSAYTSWKIPQDASTGQYRFMIVDEQKDVISLARFQVEALRKKKLDLSLNGDTVWSGGRQQLRLAARLPYTAGGAAAVAGRRITFRGSYSDGVRSPVPGYRFSDVERVVGAVPLFAPQTATVDQAGMALLQLAAPPTTAPLMLAAEMAYADPQGATHIEALSLPVWPRKHKLGLNARRGVGPGLVQFLAIVLDENNRPLANQTVTIDGAAAKRNPGAEPDGPIEESSRFEICKVKTDAEGKGACSVTWRRTTEGGWLIRGRAAGASTASFRGRADEFDEKDDYISIALKGNEGPLAGRAMTLRLHSPFFPATAFVTIEREGVFASSVHAVTQADQDIVLATERRYAPNVRLVVKLVRGAGHDMAGLASNQPNTEFENVDVVFDSTPFRLQVDLSGPPAARPGQRVAVGIKVRHGGRAVAGAAVTLLAYDDVLTNSSPNLTTQVLERFWFKRNVHMYDWSSHLRWSSRSDFGKMPRHWPEVERFATREMLTGWPLLPVPHWDGDYAGAPLIMTHVRGAIPGQIGVSFGGVPQPRVAGIASSTSATSEEAGINFAAAAVWKTDIVLDRNGRATVVVPLPDSLTRWRFVAVAIEGADRYGTGTAVIDTRAYLGGLSRK